MTRVISVAVVMLLPVPVWGNWFRSRPTVKYYYSPPPVVVYMPVCPAPIPAVAVVQPALAAPKVWAQPVPAPPSAPRIQPIPASPSPPPAIKESASFYHASTPVGDRERLAADRCSVGFWNLTAHDLTLRVEGQSWILPVGRGLTMDLPRRFRWQIDGHPEESGEVPLPESAVDVVIRR